MLRYAEDNNANQLVNKKFKKSVYWMFYGILNSKNSSIFK